jgi:hypothetical protein
MTKSISLSLHKNKVESRRKRELARAATRGVGAMIREKDIRAYAFVGIGSDGKAYALWDTGNILPLWSFADTVATVLKRDIEVADVEDGWSPSLNWRG